MIFGAAFIADIFIVFSNELRHRTWVDVVRSWCIWRMIIIRLLVPCRWLIRIDA
ncbi:hypothetical protein MGSAQ_001135 [marine sediment metagenome]|uniref:Uncharacterized protein n=1 Tax=marine sediment metagenome TaxID=412755 RepID=A0A1B6NV86_9ZZZZ